jgi:hypothetical protein
LPSPETKLLGHRPTDGATASHPWLARQRYHRVANGHLRPGVPIRVPLVATEGDHVSRRKVEAVARRDEDDRAALACEVLARARGVRIPAI